MRVPPLTFLLLLLGLVLSIVCANRGGAPSDANPSDDVPAVTAPPLAGVETGTPPVPPVGGGLFFKIRV